MSGARNLFKGSGLGARAMRSSALTLFGYGGGQVLRLASNLILTRLLFPEAFGMMVLVGIFMMGLNMFSDLGVGPSIMQNKRGDDPDFLNTAWTIQVARGVILWLCAVLLSYPVAAFYGEPQLLQLLPVASLVLLITGFNPTRLETASRHLMLGRVTAIDFATQIVGIAAAIVLAYLYQSVWALVLSGIISSLFNLLFLNVFLPGETNRFRWEKPAARELIRFGKWIFLSTIAGFILSQGDKVILGKFLPLDLLGLYNIGYFLASFPLLLGGMVVRKVMIPVYREMPPDRSAGDFAKLQKMRFGLSGIVLLLLAIFAFLGVIMVHFLYDPRYHLAGAIVVVLAAMQVPQLVALTYDQAALAAGASNRFFILAAARAALMVTGLLIGVKIAGLLGALVGQGAAFLLAYPVVIWLARKEKAWDPLHDAVIFVIGSAMAATALWLNWTSVEALLALKLP